MQMVIARNLLCSYLMLDFYSMLIADVCKDGAMKRATLLARYANRWTLPIHFNFHQLMTVYSLTAHFYLLATFLSLDLCFISATWSQKFTYSSCWTVWISAIQAWLYCATSPVSVWEYSNELQVTRHFDFSS